LQDDLDRMLDEALASYTMCEPRPGLSARIMAQARPHFPWPQCFAAALVLASVASAIWVRPAKQPERIVPVQAPVTPRVPVSQVATHPARHHRNAGQYVVLDIAQLAKPEKPLEIEAITIQPLHIDELEIGEIK